MRQYVVGSLLASTKVSNPYLYIVFFLPLPSRSSRLAISVGIYLCVL